MDAQTCRFCLRFESSETPGLENEGTCRKTGKAVSGLDPVCERSIEKVKIEKREDGSWIVLAPPSDEKCGPFANFSDINSLKIGEALNVPAKEVLKVIAQVPEDLGYPIFTLSISELKAEHVGKKVKFRGQIISEKRQKALPRSLKFSCMKCGEELKFDLSEDGSEDVMVNVIFKNYEAIRAKMKNLFQSLPCSEGKRQHSLIFEENDSYIDYAVLGVRDLLEEIQRFDKQIYIPRKVYLIDTQIPASKKVAIQGTVVIDPQTRDICVLANNIAPLETEVTGFQITEIDREEWPIYFGDDDKILSQIAPDMVGRDFVRQAYLLTLHSIAEIPDIYGRLIRGTLRVVDYGDTKTYKSESAKDLVLGRPYAFGGYVVGETSGRTGITYTIDPDEKAIIWGELPNNDLGLVVIDGLQALFAEELHELREMLESQRLIVRRSQSGEALARTRIIATLNPEKSLNSYMYPCMALKDMQAFEQTPDLTRWDIFIPFADGDVEKEAIASRKAGERPIPDETFKRHVFWTWSRKPEHVRYTDEARSLLIKKSTELMQTLCLSSLPVVHNAMRDVLTRLSVAQAALDHSVDATHTQVIVDAPHVLKAVDFYIEMTDKLGLQTYKMEEEGKLELTKSDFEDIVKDLGETEYQILDAIKIHSLGSPALASQLDVSDRTIKRHYTPLRKHGLISTSPKTGISLSPRGVKFLKLLSQSNSEIVTKPVPNKEHIGTQNVPVSPLPKPSIPEKMAIPETEQLQTELRSIIAKGTQEDFEKAIIEVGLARDESEAKTCFNKFVDQGFLVWFDEGERTLWKWVR